MKPKLYKAMQLLYLTQTVKDGQDAYEVIMNSKRSAELYKIPLANGKWLIYVPLKGIVALVNADFIKALNTSDPRIKFFVKAVENAKALPPFRREAGWPGVMICPTQTCNMRCRYCYASGGEQPKCISWPIAKRAIDYALSHSRGKIFSLAFHGGGEPTLAADIIKKAYAYAAQRCADLNLKLHSSITTNGVMDEKFAHWIADTKMTVGVSFDGPPDIQNRQRPLANGGQSYPIVVKTIKLFNDLDVDYAVLTTITDETVNKQVEIVEHFHKLGIKSAQFGPVEVCGRSNVTGVTAPNMEEFVHYYLKAFEAAKKFGMNVFNPAMQSLFPRNFYCGALFPALIVTTEGWITSCPFITKITDPGAKLFIYGKVSERGVRLNKRKLALLQSRTIRKMRSCNNCWVKWDCAGGCPTKAFRENSSMFKPARHCMSHKLLLSHLLLSILNQELNPLVFGKALNIPLNIKNR